MPRFALAVLLAALAASSALAQGGPPDADRPPFELSQSQPGEGPLSVYERLLSAEPQYQARGPARDWLLQILALQAGRVGRHDEALRWNDARPYTQRWDSVGVVPAGVSAADAVEAIVRRAERTSVVMVNEAHHDASTRLLTLRLLEPLYAQGYRYFAAETFTPDSVLRRQPPYPTAATGYYTDEPVFGAVIREAIRLGYTLVPYEIEDEQEVEADTLTRQQRRDLSEAVNLAQRTVESDPGAKVLVHAGYSHVHERPGEYFTPMAWYFRERTGIDPLTVDQTEIGPRSESRFEHPLYRAARSSGLLNGAAVVLVGSEGEPLAPVGHEAFTDLQVLRPPAERPVEALGYGALRPLALPSACGACLVNVRRMDEGEDAVPVDRAVTFEGGTVRLVGPRDVPLVVTVLDGRTGRSLDRRIVSAR